MEKMTVVGSHDIGSSEAQQANTFVRPLGRVLAREITPKEINMISGGWHQTGCTQYSPPTGDQDKQF